MACATSQLDVLYVLICSSYSLYSGSYPTVRRPARLLPLCMHRINKWCSRWTTHLNDMVYVKYCKLTRNGRDDRHCIECTVPSRRSNTSHIEKPLSFGSSTGNTHVSVAYRLHANAFKTGYFCASVLTLNPSSDAPSGWLVLGAVIGLPTLLWAYKVSYPHLESKHVLT